MAKMSLTIDGNLYARFFVETGEPPFDPSACSMTMSGSYALDTFDCYDEGDASSLPDAGTGWDGLYTITENYAQIVATDYFEEYATGSVVGDDITGGTGWDGPANIA